MQWVKGISLLCTYLILFSGYWRSILLLFSSLSRCTGKIFHDFYFIYSAIQFVSKCNGKHSICLMHIKQVFSIAFSLLYIDIRLNGNHFTFYLFFIPSDIWIYFCFQFEKKFTFHMCGSFHWKKLKGIFPNIQNQLNYCQITKQ